MAKQKLLGREVEIETLENLIDEFAHDCVSIEEKVMHMAEVYTRACRLVGEKDALDAFLSRFEAFRKDDFELLLHIANGKAYVKTFRLPAYIRHDVQKLPFDDQRRLFMQKFSVVKFSAEEPESLCVNEMNQSDWRVFFDREKGCIRKDQRAYIKAKKASFSREIRWKVENGVLKVSKPCKITLHDLKAIVKDLEKANAKA